MILAKDQEESWQSNFKDAVNHRKEIIEKLGVERIGELLVESCLFELSVPGNSDEDVISCFYPVNPVQIPRVSFGVDAFGDLPLQTIKE